MAGKSSSLRKLEALPREPLFNAYAWADYVELLCLFSIDGQITRADVVRHYGRRKDLGEEPVAEVSSEDAEESRDDSDEEWLTTEKKDKVELQIDDWFKHLKFRIGSFTDFYPFKLSDDEHTLSLLSPLSDAHRLYLFLLFASNLGYFSQHQTTLTSNFEVISREALKSLLPQQAEVHLFGKSAAKSARYSGSLWKKINILAADLNEQVVADKSEFSPHNTGDKGLDIVAWVPIEDATPNQLFVFGQCACSTDEWSDKQSSSSREAWSQTITLSSPPNNVAFIPLCFRRANGRWHVRHQIRETILIDRLRFVLLLGKTYATLRDYFSPEGLSRLVEQKAALV